MNKIFYFKDENKYKRLYFFNFKLFKIKKYFSDKYIKNIIKNIELKHENYKPCQNEITPAPNNFVLETLQKLKSFYFLPNGGNLGDGLIANSEFQIFNFYEDISYITKRDDYDKIQKPFNFIYGGGGLFVDIYKENLDKFFDIFKNKFLKQCIILPSSFYNIPELFEIADERFTIFCREKNSFNYLVNSKTKAKIYLSDDMAFATDIKFYTNSTFTVNQLNNLKENLQKMPLKQLKNIIYNMFFSYSSIYNRIKEILSVIDKKSDIKTAYLLRTDSEKNIKDIFVNSFDLSVCGRITGRNSLDNAYIQITSELFLSAIDCADVIVTDRLHVGIAATLLNKEVFLFDNSYNKVSGVYEQSMKGLKNVHLLKDNDLKSIENIIKRYNIKNTANSNRLKNMNLNIEDFLTKYLAYKEFFACKQTTD